MIGSSGKDRRAVRRRPCDMAMLVLPEVFETDVGNPPQPFWPKATERVRRKSPRFPFMAEVYWDLEWTLRSSRDSTTPTTSGFTTACATIMLGRSASIFTRASTIRISWRDSWRTTTSRGPPRLFRRKFMRRRPSSPFSRRGCDSFIRGSSKVARNASRRTWAVPEEPVDALRQFYERLLSCAAAAGRPRRPVATARMHARPGTATGPGLLRCLRLGRTPARAARGGGAGLRPPTRANAACDCRS